MPHCTHYTYSHANNGPSTHDCKGNSNDHTMQSKHFFKNLISRWLLYLESLTRSPSSVKRVTDSRTGTCLPYAEAFYHPEALLAAPRAFLKLACAALHHALGTIPTMKNYHIGKPITGGLNGREPSGCLGLIFRIDIYYYFRNHLHENVGELRWTLTCSQSGTVKR